MEENITAYTHVYRYNNKNKVMYWFLICISIFVVFLFMPWTQNIRSAGRVTTLYQHQRPQQVNTIISGQITKWYFKEGDYVSVGDTLVQLSEVKTDYLDPALLKRTKSQIENKQLSIEYYKDKAAVNDRQIEAIESGIKLKLDQLMNKLAQAKIKLQSDSIESAAALNEYGIASLQYIRQKSLYDSGLVSLTQLEQRNQVYQNAMAKKISTENKWLNSKQDLSILQLEMNALRQEGIEKIAKAQSDRFQSFTQIAGGQAEIAKLENEFSNYSIRNGQYFILASQSGQIVKAQKAGIGEIVKEGEMIAEIVPDSVQYVVEMFMKPVDLPLLETGQKVRCMFDGFPAIVFSGWPKVSSGTFGGTVFAIENNIGSNGRFRVLVTPDISDRSWPYQLKVGVGVQCIALLKDVPVWYEAWRQINSFPPDYYKSRSVESKSKSK